MPRFTSSHPPQIGCYFDVTVGWSVSNIDNSMSSPDTGVYRAVSTNEAIFSYSPVDLVTVETQNATITFYFNGGGFWRSTWSVTTA